MPTRLTVPNPRSQASSRVYPGGVAGNSSTPSSPPIGSSAAATCASACVSTPPVTARASSTMVNVIPFVVEGWHAPAGRPDLSTPASCTGQADQTGNAGGCQRNLGPADRSFRKTTNGVSRLAGQAVTRATDPTRLLSQTSGGRAGALSTSSLPITSGLSSDGHEGVGDGAHEKCMIAHRAGPK